MGQTLAKCFGPAPAAPSGVTYEHWAAFEAKMKKEGLNDAAIGAFKYNYEKLASGADLMLPESSISPVSTLPSYEALTAEDPTLLKSTVVLKLNGGLGTGMGLEKAKSLLPLKGKDTFLDFIAKQVLHMREAFGVDLAFMLMNSFSTSADTKKALKKYKGLASADLGLEFVQNKAPKVAADDLAPSSWPKSPAHEWCPPGHGDLYPAMLGSGTLDKLLAKGFKYMFVSNSDNLGATMDLKLLTWFAASGAPFAMEVAARTEADKKGGHLCQRSFGGGLLLRESAQCPDADEKKFQDTSKHKFFNTNNLWIDLVALKAAFDKFGGVLPLPVIKNSKTVDPRDKASQKVLQLETAMVRRAQLGAIRRNSAQFGAIRRNSARFSHRPRAPHRSRSSRSVCSSSSGARRCRRCRTCRRGRAAPGSATCTATRAAPPSRSTSTTRRSA